MPKALPACSDRYLIEVASGAKWMRDGSGTIPDPWAEEIEAVLRFLDESGQFKRLLPRLRDDKRAFWAVLGEGRAALFLTNLDFKILQWEPSSTTNRPGDLLVKLNSAPEIFVEVKSPDWESELSDEEQKGQRKRCGKYVQAESRATSSTEIPFEVIMRNVLPKFSDDRPNLAVIVDDLFASPADAHAVIDGDIDKFFALTETRTLGAIVFLVPENPWGQSVRYISNFYVNPNAWTRCRLPEIAVTALADRARQDAVICNI